MTQPMLIPRYPGAKSDRTKYPVWDGTTYDAAIIPFAGSLRWGIPALQSGHVRSLFVADSDPAVRAVIEQWANGDHNFLEECVSSWVDLFLTGVPSIFPECVFNDLKAIVDSWPNLPADCDKYDYAAAKILLHKLCFGGNVRTNKQGKLNISLRKDWEQALTDYFYELPWRPPSRPVSISDDWAKAFEQFAKSDCENAIAFIDPPYYAPGNSPRVKGGMSTAYSNYGGNPNSQGVFELFTGAIRAAVADPRITRIVATNYWGHELQTIAYDSQGNGDVIKSEWVVYGETTEFMHALGFHHHDLSSLQSMNNRNFNEAKAGTVEQRTIRHEGWWERGGVLQHGRIVQPDLLSLLEVAA